MKKWSNRWWGLVFGMLLGVAANENVLAQSCSVSDKPELGTIVKVEKQSADGQICGFSEYTYKGEWTGATYEVGDSVIHSGIFWKCIGGGGVSEPECGSGDWMQIDAVRYATETLTINNASFWNVPFYNGPISPYVFPGWHAEYKINYLKVSSYDESCDFTQTCSGSYFSLIYHQRPDSNYEIYSEENYQYDEGCETRSGTYYNTYYGGPTYSGSDTVSISGPPIWALTTDPGNCGIFPFTGNISEEETATEKTYTSEGDCSRDLSTYNYHVDSWRESSEKYNLSDKKTGAEAMGKAMPSMDEEGWEEGATAVSYVGNWSEVYMQPKFAFEGQVVRGWVAFGCVAKDAEIEVTFSEWPMCGTEAEDGKEEKEIRTVKEDDIQEQADGSKWVKVDVGLKDGYYRRLVSVAKLTSCGGGTASNAGNSNGANTGSAHWWVSLGKDVDGGSVGNLRFGETEMSADSATPKRLSYDGGNNEAVEVIKDEWGIVEQIKAPECLANIEVIDAYSYEIQFYDLADVEPEVETVSVGSGATLVESEIPTGKYTVSGVPFSVWKVENPDGVSGHTKVKITHEEGEGEEEYLFTESGAGEWSLESGGGLRTEELTETTVSGNREVVREIKGSGGVASYKVREVYHPYAWGERLIEEEVDPDGAGLTTTWDYYDDDVNDGGAYGQVKEVVYANGSWARYEYDSDRRPVKTVSTWLDGNVGASEGSSRVETTTWSVDGLTATIVETTAGQETGRRYGVKSAGQMVNKTSTVAGASISAGTNLVTTTTYETTGEFKGEVLSVTHADGTKTLYDYDHTGGEITRTSWSGEPNGGGTAIVAGRQVTAVEDELGNLISSETKDIASGLVTESYEVTDQDEFGRPLRIDYSDGTFEEKTYSCCGVESEVDRDGVETLYTYDELKRVASESRAGLTTLYTYDGSGRVLTRTRQGSDSSEIVQETNEYDLAGRLTSVTNALEEETTMSESVNGSGQTVRTTTLPDTGARVETTHKDGQLYTVSGTGVHPQKMEYGTHSNGLYRKEIKIGVSSSESEWIKSTSDLAGRTVEVESAGGGVATSTYNALGQLEKQEDADGVTQLFTYNGEGNREKQILDLDGSGAESSGDQITISERSVLTAHGETVERQETRIVNASNAEVVASRVDTTPNGHQSWSEQWGLESTGEVSVGSGGEKTETITQPDGSELVRESTYGRSTSEVLTTSGSVVVSSVSYTYDPQGRLESSADLRNGTTSYTYNDLDQIVSVTTPNPAGGSGAQTTSYEYDEVGRQTVQTLPDSTEVATEYYLTGEVKKRSGSQTYTTDYTYDPQGRVLTLMTTGAAGSETTTWAYDTATGWLSSKTDAASKSVSYTYTDAGRLETRTWARGISATYSYNDGGLLEGVDYSDGTPDVTYTLNRLGQVTEITDGAGTRTLTYTADGRPLSETYTAGLLNGVSSTNGYDSLLRRDEQNFTDNGAVTSTVAYGYDGASRLLSVTAGSDVATYTYETNSSLINTIEQDRGAAMLLTTSKSYDHLNRLTDTDATAGGATVISAYEYTYNDLNQRTVAELEDGTTWEYGYDGKGQVTSGGRKWSDNSPVEGQQYGYAFDGIGNRTSATVNGRTATYTSNALNQYTARQVSGALDVIGSAAADATVTINSQPTDRKGTYFYGELSINNTSAPKYTEVTTVAVKNGAGTGGADLIGEVSGNLYLAKTPEAFTYDDDGNLLTDGRWTYTWDGENRLIAMESIGTVPVGAKRKLEFKYDSQGRRVSKMIFDWSGSAYVAAEEKRFAYDGWNVIAELDDDNEVTQGYVWGVDLSGGLQGAGGVGGLLAIKAGSESYYPTYDGNGNVMSLLKASDESVVARYHYGPFGEPIQSFEDGVVNPFRFSSKYHDNESGLAYYGYRYYNPSSGRWINRDPIGEQGGVNVYGFLKNNGITRVDLLGWLGFDSFKKIIDSVCSDVGNAKTLSWTEWNDLIRNKFNLSSDKYLITRKNGIIDLQHFLSGANVALKNPSWNERTYVYGGKYATQDGSIKEYLGTIQRESNSGDIEDVPSDWSGFQFGELIGSGTVGNIKVDIKNCTCDMYRETVINALSGFGPLSDSEHSRFLDAYTPVSLPLSPASLAAQLEGGRTGWFIRMKFRGSVRDYRSHIPFRQVQLSEAISALGM